jgi:hypothetical protein
MESPVMRGHCSKTTTMIPHQRARHLHSRHALHVSQNARLRCVVCETDIDNYVRQCTIIVDGTKIYRFSKELLAYIEMCVAFSQYYRQDEPRTAGAMDTYFREALQAYADVTYKDLHDYLARRFHAWYAKFKPSSSAVVRAEDPELGAVVSVKALMEQLQPLRDPGSA